MFALLLVMAPGSASAGSLLSGYGGPGGGTQALLGSTLIGTHSSGAGGGGSSGGPSTPSGTQASGNGSPTKAQGSGAAGAGKGTGGASSSTAAPGTRSGVKHSGARGSASGTSAGGAAAYTSSGGSPSRAGTVAVSDSSPLGITRTDALLLVFVLGVLGITLGLTRRLARMQHNI